MILLIGRENCPRCEMTKKILNEKDINFEYRLLSDMDNKLEVEKMAKDMGMTTLPLILNDGNLVELQEVLS